MKPHALKYHTSNVTVAQVTLTIHRESKSCSLTCLCDLAELIVSAHERNTTLTITFRLKLTSVTMDQLTIFDNMLHSTQRPPKRNQWQHTTTTTNTKSTYIITIQNYGKIYSIHDKFYADDIKPIIKGDSVPFTYNS